MLLFCTDLIFALICSWNESVCWVCKDEPKINSAGWIVVTKDISAYFLMQTFVSIWWSVFLLKLLFCTDLNKGLMDYAFRCCWLVLFGSVCWVCKDEPKINSAGWIVVTKDISAYFLMQTFVSLWSIGSFWLVPSCCWSMFFDAFVLHCDLCVLMLTESVCWVCKDEPQINSAGWIVVTKDISAYFLMQTFVSLWSIGSFWLVPSCCWSVFFDALVLHCDLCVLMLTESVCWVCKDEPQINSAGWIVVTKDISAYFLMQTFVSLLYITCCWDPLAGPCFCQSFCFVLIWFLHSDAVGSFCLLGLQGWTTDKFSGLNCSDERHLRLLSDADLCQLVVAYGWYPLVAGMFFLALVLHWSELCAQMLLAESVCCEKGNSTGWIFLTNGYTWHILFCFCFILFFCCDLCFEVFICSCMKTTSRGWTPFFVDKTLSLVDLILFGVVWAQLVHHWRLMFLYSTQFISLNNPY